MFDALHRLLTASINPTGSRRRKRLSLALAVLLIDVARSDDRVVDHEEGGIISISPAIRCSITYNVVLARLLCLHALSADLGLPYTSGSPDF